MSHINKPISRRIAIQSGSAVAGAVAIRRAYAQDASPAATAVASPEASPVAASIPSVGTENQTRGEGGELRLLQWQAPTTLNRYKSTGVKDYLAGSLVLEPLFAILADGSLAPILANDVPSKEAGTLAEDLTWVTVSLKPDVLWSDGEPFSAKDVRFTWEWNVNQDNGSFGYDNYIDVSDVEIIDDLTVTFRFTQSNPIWFEVVSGSGGTVILPEHVLREQSQEVNDAFGLNPVGTGPFVLDTFTPNDQATFVANDKYREENKPYFSSVLLKGGGDAAAAARAVLQTGEFDFAWYVNVEPDVLDPLIEQSEHGTLEVTPQISLEYIDINHSDPRTEVDGESSQKDTPNPILSDPKVREAITIAINRELISSELYVSGNPAAQNIIVGNPIVNSPNNDVPFDPTAAAVLLDEAGWVLEGDAEVRTKDGQELTLTYATTVNSVRQKTQAIIQANLAAVGVKVVLEQVDAGLFFDGSAGNTQNITHFPWDLQQYASNIMSARPIRFLNGWYGGSEGENIAQKSNSWTGGNNNRWQNDEFDTELEAARIETDDATLVERLINANDILVQNFVSIPLIQLGTNVAYNNRLNPENFAFGPFEYQYWNIANWNTVKE